MPYPSTRFSQMTADQISSYRASWTAALSRSFEEFKPGIIHAHHAWILSSVLKDAAGSTPVVVHGHGTALRQLELCPHLGDEVREGCRRNDLFVVLHQDHARLYREEYGLREEQLAVVGAGYREELFHSREAMEERGDSILFAGKISESKGLSSLLDAFEILRARRPGARLEIAGSGSGEETERLVASIVECKYQAEEVAVFLGRSDIQSGADEQDELFDDAVRLVFEYNQASTSFLQRRMKIGYSRAARLMDELESAHIVGPAEGAKPREILIETAEMEAALGA